jgi:hypothetical protein
MDGWTNDVSLPYIYQTILEQIFCQQRPTSRRNEKEYFTMAFSKNALLTILLLSMKEHVDAFVAPSIRVSSVYDKQISLSRLLQRKNLQHITSQRHTKIHSKDSITHLSVESTRFIYERSGRTDITLRLRSSTSRKMKNLPDNMFLCYQNTPVAFQGM